MGELTIEGASWPVFECAECIVQQDLLGVTFDAAVMFCVGDDGLAFDPAAAEGEPPAWAPAPLN